MMSIIYNIVLRHLLLRYNKRHRLTVTPGYNKTSDWISREIILLEIESLLEIWKLYGGDEKDEKIHLIPAEGLNTQFTHRQRNTLEHFTTGLGLNALRQGPELPIHSRRMLGLG